MRLDTSAIPSQPDPDFDPQIDPNSWSMTTALWLLGLRSEPAQIEKPIGPGDVLWEPTLRFILARLAPPGAMSQAESDALIAHLLPEFLDGEHARDAALMMWPQGFAGERLDHEGRCFWRRLVLELPPRHRAAVVLHDSLGLNAQRLAALMGVPRATVRRLVHQARLALCGLAARTSRQPEQRWW